MADLCRLTSLLRQAIHFYIQEGLVPPGRKIGRNNARYREMHVERIRIVRQLQNERFLPLKAIRAVPDARDDAFTPAQLGLLGDVKRDWRRRWRSLAPEANRSTRHAARAPRPRRPHGLEGHDLGFDAKLLRVYERAVTSLVGREGRALSRRMATVAPDRVAAMLEKAMPLVHEFFAR